MTTFYNVLLSVLIFQSTFALTSGKHNLDIDRTIECLENVADFYVKNIDKLNLDSIYGLRVAQGGLAIILKTLSIEHVNPYFQRLNSLHGIIRNAAKKALPYLKEYKIEYYNKFRAIVEKPWTAFEHFRKIKLNMLPNKEHNVQQRFNEKISDKCMTEIIGTRAQMSPCHVSSDCFKLMTSSTLKGYGNTHQILYFLLGFQTGCRQSFEKEFQKFRRYLKKANILDVDQFLEKKCLQILVEMKGLKENVMVKGETDLFMEQGLVCGILGYEDFLHRDILNSIFTWQDKEYGCFGRKKSQVQEYDASQFLSRITMRKIMYDRTLDNGCSSHETGVATGLLSIYLRWLILSKPEFNQRNEVVFLAAELPVPRNV